MERRRGGADGRRRGAVRVRVAAARGRPRAGAGGRRQQLGEDRRADVTATRSTCCGSRAAGGTWRRSSRRASRRCGSAPVARLAELRRCPTRRMANELQGGVARPGGAGAVGGVDPARHAAAPVRAAHPRRRGGGADQHARRRRRSSREVYGDEVVVVPYVMPGFDLARRCAEMFPAEPHDGTVGMVLLNHGLFTFADDARTAYERHVELVGRAWPVDAAGTPRASRRARGDGGRRRPVDIGALGPVTPRPGRGRRAALVDLPPTTIGPHHAGHLDDRRAASDTRGRRPAASSARRREPLSPGSTAGPGGPATPDHVLRTKRLPLLGRDVGALRRATTGPTSSATARGSATGRSSLSTPRRGSSSIPSSGVLAAGRRVGDAGSRGRDLRAHHRGHRAGRGARRLPQHQRGRPLRRRVLGARAGQARPPAARRPPLTGQVALVTGRGVGHRPGLRRWRCSARAPPSWASTCPTTSATWSPGPSSSGVTGDVTDPRRRRPRRWPRAVRAFGGLDMLVRQRRRVPGARARWPSSTRRRGRRTHGGQRRRRASPCSALAHPYLAPCRRRAAAWSCVGSKNVPAPGHGRRRLLGVEGRADPARPGRGAGVGPRRHPGQRRAPRRGVRHRPVDRRPDRPARRRLRPDPRGVPHAATCSARGAAATWPTPPWRCAARRSPAPPAPRSRSTAATSASSDRVAPGRGRRPESVVEPVRPGCGQNVRGHHGARAVVNRAAARATAPRRCSSTHPAAARRPHPVPPR